MADGENPISTGHAVSLKLPIFSAPSSTADPEAAKLFWFKLAAWYRACGRGRPLREYLPLAMEGRIAEKWVFDLLDTDPDIAEDHIKDRFLARFAAEARRPSTVARDKLHAGAVSQKSGQDVIDFFSLFMDVVRDVHDMTEGEKIRWFQAGLTPPLRATCACDHTGREFTSLDDCLQFAYGEERKLKIKGTAAGQSRKHPTEQEPDAPDAKRPRTATVSGGTPAARAPRTATEWLEYAKDHWGPLTAPNTRFAHLTNAQVAQCMAKGLCCHCYQDMAAGHQPCPNRQAPLPFPDN
jgi:hypothetical protein